MSAADEKNERRAVELLDLLAARDYDAATALFAQDARYHVSAWHAPVTGHGGIRAEFERQSALYSEFRYQILRTLSNGDTVVTERLDTITIAGRPVTLHWVGVFEFAGDGLITAVRDYYDTKELEAGLAPAAG